MCSHCKLKPVTRKRAEYCSKACSNAARGRSLAERFLDYYKPGAADACWPWAGTVDANGYGVIADDNRRQLRAHRIAYERVNGAVSESRYVCHSCDNPSCVNPNHLWLGSAADNNEDKRAKLRHSHGASHGMAKISENDVRDIRGLYPQMSQQAIADRYGLHQTTVSDIIRGKIWTHIV